MNRRSLERPHVLSRSLNASPTGGQPAEPPPRLVPDRELPAYAYVPGESPHPKRDRDGHSFGSEPDTPEPDPTPEPGSFEGDKTPRETAEQTYRRIVDGMDELDFLDPDAAFGEAARQWLAARQAVAEANQLAVTPHHKGTIQ